MDLNYVKFIGLYSLRGRKRLRKIVVNMIVNALVELNVNNNIVSYGTQWRDKIHMHNSK